MDIKSEFKSLIRADKRLSRLVRVRNLSAPLRKASEMLAHSGDGKPWWPVLILIWVFGSIFWKQWAITVMIGIALLGLFTWPIKHLVNRKRPIGLWGQHTRMSDPQSFPSGHASRTFLLAVIATGIGPAWLAILFWVWAPLVSLARVAMGVHFMSDVVGGFVLAVVVGLLWLLVHEGALQLLLAFTLRVLHVPLW